MNRNKVESMIQSNSICLGCAAYYKNAGINIDNINDQVERLEKFRGQYCRGQRDLSGCDLGPYQEGTVNLAFPSV